MFFSYLFCIPGHSVETSVVVKLAVLQKDPHSVLSRSPAISVRLTFIYVGLKLMCNWWLTFFFSLLWPLIKLIAINKVSSFNRLQRN